MSDPRSRQASILDTSIDRAIIQKRKCHDFLEFEYPLKGLLDLFQQFPVFDRICSFLGIAEIRSLTRTCKKLSGVYRDLLRTQWNVDIQLRRFVKNPHEFRSQLGRHDALISGSFALQYFERAVWKESGLDVFIKEESGADFMNYLSVAEGYRLSSIWIKEPPCLIMKEKNEIYVKSATGSKIRLIYTQDIPVMTILKNSSTTAVVNIISWNKAYAIFPLSTFVHRKTYLSKPLDGRIGPLLANCSRRGWKSQQTLWFEEEGLSHPIRPLRRIGDCFTWAISFDTGNVKWSKTPNYVLEHSHFNVGKKFKVGSEHHKINVSFSSACLLQHCYAEAKVIRSFFEFIKPRLDSLTRLELIKIPQDERPSFFGEAMQEPRELHRFFKPPPGWNYVDDEIPRWYKEWEQRWQTWLEKEGGNNPEVDDFF